MRGEHIEEKGATNQWNLFLFAGITFPIGQRSLGNVKCIRDDDTAGSKIFKRE